MAANAPALPLAGLYAGHPLHLGTRCIRVMDIVDFGDSGSISVSLRVVDLDTRPAFTALSYVWGSYAPEPHIIHCEGFNIIVTANCYSALWHLRNKLDAFPIWVDAICINQASDREKMLQIPLMDLIYSNARSVVVWLGEGNASTDRAMRYLGNAGMVEYFDEKAALNRPFVASVSVYTSRWSFTRHPYLFEGTAKGWRLPAFMRFSRFKDTIHATYEDLEDLLSRDWIRRIWTYQELLLASRPVIVCGNAHLPWDRFQLSIVFLEDTGINYEDIVHPKIKELRSWKRLAFSRDRLMKVTSPTKLQKYQMFVHRLVGWRNLVLKWFYPFIGICSGSLLISVILIAVKYTQPSARISISISGCLALLIIFAVLVFLSCADRLRRYFCHQPATRAPVEPTISDDLIDGLSKRRAKDPKDMAFGVRAVLQQRSRLALPAPDYSRSTGQIYRELTDLLLEITGSLQLLLFAALKSCPHEPSWVPDWAFDFHQQWPDLEIHISDFHEYRSEAESKRARGPIASNAMQFSVTKSDRDGLIVHSRHLCTVTHVFVLLEARNDDFDNGDAAHRHNLEIILKLHKQHQYSGSFSRFLFRLFRVKYPDNLGSARLLEWCRFVESHSKKGLDETLGLLQGHEKINFLPLLDRCGVGLGVLPRRSYHDIRVTHVDICNAIAKLGRAAFIGNNKQMGLCSQRVRVADQVMFVQGAPLPLMLRRRERVNTSELVSPAVFADEDFNYVKASGSGNTEDYETIILN